MLKSKNVDAQLVVIGGEADGQGVKLRLPATIGRGKEASITVPHALVSRLHCQIQERDGILVVKDMASLNGTYVNNLKITNEQPLLPGELLTLGSVTFRAEYIANSPKQADSIPHKLGMSPHSATNGHSRMLATPSPSKSPSVSASTKGDTAPSLAAKLPNQIPSASKQPPVSPETMRETAAKLTKAKRPFHDTPKINSINDSTIDFEELGFGTPDKSISLSNLNALPNSNRNVSFVGEIGEPTEKNVDVEALKIQLRQDAPKAEKIDADRLDSFIKKNQK